MGEIIFLLLIGATSGLYYYQTLSYRMPKLDNSGGPAIFPKFVCLILIGFVIIRIIQIILKKEKKEFHFFEIFKGTKGLLFISFTVLVFVIKPLGFVLTCFLFLSFVANALMYSKENTLGSTKSIIIREVIFLAFPIALYYFFTKVLFVALPAGILGNLL